jgi:hypothetical protein
MDTILLEIYKWQLQSRSNETIPWQVKTNKREREREREIKKQLEFTRIKDERLRNN